MNFQHILNAMNDCDQGNLIFNRGYIDSFAFNGRWYPVRKIIIQASIYANEPTLNITTHSAIVILSKFIPVNIVVINYPICNSIAII